MQTRQLVVPLRRKAGPTSTRSLQLLTFLLLPCLAQDFSISHALHVCVKLTDLSSSTGSVLACRLILTSGQPGREGQLCTHPNALEGSVLLMKIGIEHSTRLAWSAHACAGLSGSSCDTKCTDGFVVRRISLGHVIFGYLSYTLSYHV